MWPRVNGLRTMALGTPGEMRARLNQLVLHGTKTATAGLLSEYAAEDEEVEQPGERLTLVDDANTGIGTIEVTDVQVLPFRDVPWEFAAAEGEGDASIEDWRAGHRDYWTRAGEHVTEESDVVCVNFRLI